MKIEVPKMNSDVFLRRCGYARIFDHHSRQFSYARRLGPLAYPRFHVYAEEKDGKIFLNLHLDQRATRYEGVTAHSGEYDGAIVEGEAQRIRGFKQETKSV